jgi:hypothetical protein
MTYRDLLNLLSKMDNETLNQNVTVGFQDEFYPANVLFADDTQSVLDEGHLFIAVKEG